MSLTIRERARRFCSNMAGVDAIEQTILADRQTLQSEIVKRLQLEREGFSDNARLVLNGAIGIVQAVFGQYGQPEESKPEKLLISQEEFNQCIKQANENAGRIQAESDRRVLAEREACVRIVEEFLCDHRDESIPCDGCVTVEQIRARSNQVERMLSFAERIAALHQWLAEDQEIIQQLNESNQKLAEENRKLAENR